MQQPYSPEICYYDYTRFPGWRLAPAFLSGLIEEYRPKVVFEIGSGANPTMEVGEVMARGLRYITSDVSDEELRKAPPGYETRQLNVECPSLQCDLTETCDLIFSRMVNEHIHDGRQYHTNIWKMLRPGGVAVHCCSTLYTLPFAVNYLLPDSLSGLLLRLISPRQDYKQQGKFRAYYSWSRGPSKTMIQKFNEIGFLVKTFNGYFGHDYYKHRLPALDKLEDLKTRYLVRHPNPRFCAFATVVLQKPW